MIIKELVIGPLENNCYIIADENSKECMVIDPGDEPDRILDVIQTGGFQVKYVVCTHGHFDHVGAVSDIKKDTDAKVVLHRDEITIYKSTKNHAALWGFELDEQPEPDLLVSEGDILEFGSEKFVILHTPGHSPGGICLYSEGVIVTGDTLFAGSVGRTDFPGGDIFRLKDSFKRLMSLPDETRVLPGHGPESTIGREKRNNFFVHEL